MVHDMIVGVKFESARETAVSIGPLSVQYYFVSLRQDLTAKTL